ncbi:MAG: hypothetical protein ACI38Q_07155 [Candidatus Bruticola sp.]
MKEFLYGPVRHCIVYAAPISGQPAEDPFHIFNEGHVAVYFQCEEYCMEKEEDSEGHTECRYLWKDLRECNKLNKSKQAFICEDIPINLDECEINGWETIKDLKDFLPSVCSDKKHILPTDPSYYYSQGFGDYIGNKRYLSKVVRQNSPVTFTAAIGDEKVSVTCIKSGYASDFFAFFDFPTLFVNGNEEDLDRAAFSEYLMGIGCAWGLLFAGVLLYKLFDV